MSALTPDEISSALEIEGKLNGIDGPGDKDLRTAIRVAKNVRRAGYASSVGSIDPNVSAIAVPVRVGETIGSINIIFFRKVMSPKDAASRFLHALRHCVDTIVEELSHCRE